MNADLRVRLNQLPGFDPVGLRLYRWSDGLYLGVVIETPAEMSGYATAHAGRIELGWLGGCAVDLSGASTRDRVARWLAWRLGIPIGCTAPEWATDIEGWSMFAGESPERAGMACWDLDGRGAGAAGGKVEGLAGLDPTADTRLPDGSRLVDAVALARVAVHVGGQP